MIGLEGLLVYVAVSTSNLVASNLAISLVHGISSIVKEFKEDADGKVAADHASLHGPVLELYSRVYVLLLYSVLGQSSTKGGICFCFSVLIHCLVFISSSTRKVRRSGHSC
jgi:hypothetical protein